MTAVKQEFIHKVDKAKIPTCNILGVDIAAVDMVWLLDYLNDNIHALSGDYICVSNVHTTVTAYEDVEYRKVQMVELWQYQMADHFLQLAKNVVLRT